MKLISQIIEDLTEDNKSLNASLLKTKVLADKMNNDSVFAWVNNELNGYPNVNELPEYRILPASATGTFANRFQVLKNVPIPTMNLDKEFQEFLTKMKLTNSVSNLEHHINNDKGELGITIPMEFCNYISQQVGGNAYLQFGRVTVGRNMIVELLNNVRSRLLDFLLKIRKEFNEEENYDDKPKVIDNIFNGTIIGSNVIFSGNQNQQTLTYTVNQNDLNSFKDFLRKNSVDEADIIEVESILEKDKPNIQSKEYGPKIKKWMTKMLGKAVEGTWKIGTEVAAKIITEALKQYYGF